MRRRNTPQNVTQADIDAVRADTAALRKEEKAKRLELVALLKEEEANRQKLTALNEEEAKRHELAAQIELTQEWKDFAVSTKAFGLSLTTGIAAKMGEGLLGEALGLVNRRVLTRREMESIFGAAKALRKSDPRLYVNFALMVRSMVDYERELEYERDYERDFGRVERRVMEVEKMFECWRGVGGHRRDGKGECECESADKNETANIAQGVVPGAGGVEEKKLVDLREWPLPPKRTSWIMVQGERKRKRHTKH